MSPLETVTELKKPNKNAERVTLLSDSAVNIDLNLYSSKPSDKKPFNWFPFLFILQSIVCLLVLNLLIRDLNEMHLKLEDMKSGSYDVKSRSVQMPCLDGDFKERSRRGVSGSTDEHRQTDTTKPQNLSSPFALQAVHLRGAFSELQMDGNGLVAPWLPDWSIPSHLNLVNQISFNENRGVIKIKKDGLYFIYAQVFYISGKGVSAYSIGLAREEEEIRILTNCPVSNNSYYQIETSCFTSLVYYLHTGDQLFIKQRESNRVIVFRDGHTFFGLVLLNDYSKH